MSQDEERSTPRTLEDYVGESVPYGEGWACARCKAASREMPSTAPTWIQDLPSSVHTGDVVLFSSKHSTSNIAKFFTNSAWDHVGIVVRPTPGRAYLVEWGGGLFASELVERLTEYHEYDARSIVIRNLRLGRHRERQEDLMEEFVDMLFREQLGGNHAVPFEQVTRAARRQFKKRVANEAVIDDLTTLFCSKTVAVAYKSIGILDQNRDAADFLPKHFSYIYDDFLDLRLGASLGPEVRITFESPAVRTAFTALLSLSGIDYLSGRMSRHRAAMCIQKSARRRIATRERERRSTENAESQGTLSRGRAALGQMLARRTASMPALRTKLSDGGARTAREERATLLREVSAMAVKHRPRAQSVLYYPASAGASDADSARVQPEAAQNRLSSALGSMRNLVGGSMRDLSQSR